MPLPAGPSTLPRNAAWTIDRPICTRHPADPASPVAASYSPTYAACRRARRSLGLMERAAICTAIALAEMTHLHFFTRATVAIFPRRRHYEQRLNETT